MYMLFFCAMIVYYWSFLTEGLGLRSKVGRIAARDWVEGPDFLGHQPQCGVRLDFQLFHQRPTLCGMHRLDSKRHGVYGVCRCNHEINR